MDSSLSRGEIQSFSALTSLLTATSVTITEGVTSFPVLTQHTSGRLTLNGGTVGAERKLPPNIDGTSLYVSGGATLSFPGVTSYLFVNGIGVGTFRSTGVGSVLDLANLTTFTGGSGHDYQSRLRH